jgi:dihydroorotase
MKEVQREVDVIVRGGTLFATGSATPSIGDVAIDAGHIVGIGSSLNLAGRITIDAAGLLVTPGLIDLHAHVYPGAMPGAVPPDVAGVGAGVTTVVDAGSAGSHTIDGLMQELRHADTRVLAFLNLARTGQTIRPEIRTVLDIDVNATYAAVNRYPDRIRGLKLRLAGTELSAVGDEVLRVALTIRDAIRLPLMVHVGDADCRPLIRKLLAQLVSGDIISHACTGLPGGLVENGAVIPGVERAVKRGVRLDVAHGVRNFTFAVADLLIERGFIPDTISTDLAVTSRRGPSYSLTECMTKMLALGLPLTRVVQMVTQNAVAALGDAEITGGLAIGGRADISVLETVKGRWRLTDSSGAVRTCDTAIVPRLAIRDGSLCRLGWGPHPRGWLPEVDPQEGDEL